LATACSETPGQPIASWEFNFGTPKHLLGNPEAALHPKKDDIAERAIGDLRKTVDYHGFLQASSS
jgi:hypothetical protein